MDTGVWTLDPGLRTAFLNPLYLPQLFFRTPFAMVTAGLVGLGLVLWFTDRSGDFRARAVRWVSIWTLLWSCLWLAGAVTYWRAVPETLTHNLDVALATIGWEHWSQVMVGLIAAAVTAVFVLAVWGVAWPRRLPGVLLVFPCLLAIWLLGYFERVREFIRKPDIIAAHMYSNGLRAADYPLYQQEGLLRHAVFSPVRSVTEENRLEAGREMFKLACTRCHTTWGVNSVVAKLGHLYGEQTWQTEVIQDYLTSLHNVRPFMPPVPGTEDELAALAAFLIELHRTGETLPGAQTAGFSRSPN
jgi:hypothetical protein